VSHAHRIPDLGDVLGRLMVEWLPTSMKEIGIVRRGFEGVQGNDI
jgi:hypothetical protein